MERGCGGGRRMRTRRDSRRGGAGRGRGVDGGGRAADRCPSPPRQQRKCLDPGAGLCFAFGAKDSRYQHPVCWAHGPGVASSLGSWAAPLRGRGLGVSPSLGPCRLRQQRLGPARVQDAFSFTTSSAWTLGLHVAPSAGRARGSSCSGDPPCPKDSGGQRPTAVPKPPSSTAGILTKTTSKKQKPTQKKGGMRVL